VVQLEEPWTDGRIEGKGEKSRAFSSHRSGRKAAVEGYLVLVWEEELGWGSGAGAGDVCGVSSVRMLRGEREPLKPQGRLGWAGLGQIFVFCDTHSVRVRRSGIFFIYLICHDFRKIIGRIKILEKYTSGTVAHGAWPRRQGAANGRQYWPVGPGPDAAAHSVRKS
jgi:hypothetical protein